MVFVLIVIILVYYVQKLFSIILNCTQCAREYVRSSTGGCTNVCIPNFYVNLVENIYSPCETRCQECISLTKCNRCVDQNLKPLNSCCQRNLPGGENLVENICISSFGVLKTQFGFPHLPMVFMQAMINNVYLAHLPV
jgi:hypothetical protein